MKQYIRAYINPVTGVIEHVVAQDAPMTGENMIEGDFDTEDMEIEAPSFLRARKIMDRVENKDGKIRLKAQSGFSKTKEFPRKKFIST